MYVEEYIPEKQLISKFFLAKNTVNNQNDFFSLYQKGSYNGLILF